MSHYDTLGVQRTASAADIKKAWRRKSSAAHPDRQGGSTQAQQALNAAYEVLCSPERREHYDRTGEDGPKSSTPAQEAAAMLERFFQDSLAHDAPVMEFVEACIDNLEQEARGAIVGIDRKTVRLKRKRQALKHPSASNPFHDLVDRELAQAAATRASAETLLTITPIVRQLLGEYRSTEAPPAPRRPQTSDPFSMTYQFLHAARGF